MKKRNVRWISFLVTLLLVFSGVPVQAFALEDEAEVTSPPVAAEEMTTEHVSVIEDEVIGRFAEVVERREENVKHFRMDDGTYQAVVYGAPVHRLDAAGGWTDIDNRLLSATVAGKQSYATSDGRVRMAERFTTAEPLLTLSEGETSIAMTWLPSDTLGGSLSTAPMTLPTIVNAAEKAPLETFSDFAAAAEVDNRTSIVYADVATGTDLEYILDGNDVKENILVKAKRASYEYTVLLTLSGLTATAEASGAITIADAETGATKYRIPAPYMYDSAGEVSYAVAYELMEVKEGLYLLAVTADAAWINAEGRALPVTIDPTLEYAATFYDSYVDYSYPNANYGSNSVMKIGSGKTAYVHMTMPTLPTGVTVSTGTYYFYYTSGGSAGNISLYVDRPYMSWSESTITANNAPDTGGAALDQRSFTLTSSASSTVKLGGLDISDAIGSWLAAPDGNYGIAISGVASSGVVMNIMTSEAAVSYRPYMTIGYVYDVPEGVYAIKAPSLAYYIGVTNDSATAGALVRTKQFTTSPAWNFDNTGLWKISEVGTRRYVIRSMINNTIGLGVSNMQVVTKTLPADDADVAAEDTFYIYWDGDGVQICTNDRDYLISGNNTLGNVSLFPTAGTPTAARWYLQQYTGTHRGSAVVNLPTSWRSTGMPVGTSGSASLSYAWTTHLNANQFDMVLREEDTALGAFTWTAASKTMTFAAQNPGRVQIDVTCTTPAATVAGTAGYVSFAVIPVAGTYYLQNAGSQKYMDVEGPTTDSGAKIQQWAFSAASQKKWIIEHVANTDGFVRFKSVYSNLYLGIDSSNSSLVKQYALTSTNSDMLLWRIDRTSAGNLRIINKTTDDANKTLAVPLNNTTNGTDLTQVTYTEDENYYDEWRIFQVKYELTVHHYYDQGYLVRFSNIDENSTEDEVEAAHAQVVADIQAYQAVCSQVYLELFGLLITSDVDAYKSCADACVHTCSEECVNPCTALPTFENTKQSCGHTQTDHKISDAIRNDLISQYGAGTSTLVKVAWTGHMLDNPRSNSNLDTQTIVMATGEVTSSGNNYSDEVIRSYRVDVLMHELSHMLGAADHYCYLSGYNSSNPNKDCDNPYDNCYECDGDENTEAPHCIMLSIYKFDVEDLMIDRRSNEIFCEQCMSASHQYGIRRHLEEHHQISNP